MMNAGGEFELIWRFFIPLGCRDVPVSIGDDAARIPVGIDHVCTDTLVAGTHFMPCWSLRHVGYKAVAVNVSDLMAMGAEPRWIQLALTLPEGEAHRLSELSAGVREACDHFGVCVTGGDTTRGDQWVITVTALGTGLSSDALWRRAGAQPGDLIGVTGTLGDAALGLEQLLGEVPPSVETEQTLALQRPRLPLATWRSLLAYEVHAAIDVSDGLVQDAGHIAAASRVALVLSVERLPLSGAVRSACQQKANWDLPLYGGEDYQLLVTLPPSQAHKAAKAGLITLIGHVERGHGVRVLEAGCPIELSERGGFQHF